MVEDVAEIVLDGRNWLSKDDFYNSLLPALEAPEWHGHNLDALNDTLSGGDINGVNPPLVFRIAGLTQMGGEARKVVDGFAELIRDLQRDGVTVEIFTS